MINIDFLIAGCDTRCRHCYVNGGPAPLMPVDDALACFAALDRIGEYLPADTSFTLDQEPFGHPQLDRIMDRAARMTNIRYYHHGMTTGLALMRRPDREDAVRAYTDRGYRDFGITVHGNAAHHDGIVRRKGAFMTSVEAAKFLKGMGCRVQISLMLNRHFASDAEEISRLLDEVRPDDVWFANPIFTPHPSMAAFEPFRATLDTIGAIRPYLTRWRQDEHEVTENAFLNSVAAAAERLRQTPLSDLWAMEQPEKYLSLHSDCRLYYGNSGAETRCLGDIRTLEPEKAADMIRSLPGNRDCGAFYDAEKLPAEEDVRAALESLPPGLTYGDFESVLYRAFTELGVPTKLLPADEKEDNGYGNGT